VRIPLDRHAMPMIDQAAPGRLRLPGDACLVAGDEPTAAETPRFATGDLPIGADTGFAEVRRDTGWDPGHERLARPYVIGVTQDGWKPPTPIVDRFDRALITDARSGLDFPEVIAVGPVGDSADEPGRLPSSLQAVAVTGRGPVVTEPLVPEPLLPEPLLPEPLLPEPLLPAAGTGR